MPEKFEFIHKELKDRSDRELEMTKVILLREKNKSLKSIANNVQFFFYLTIVSLVISLIALLAT